MCRRDRQFYKLKIKPDNEASFGGTELPVCPWRWELCRKRPIVHTHLFISSIDHKIDDFLEEAIAWNYDSLSSTSPVRFVLKFSPHSFSGTQETLRVVTLWISISPIAGFSARSKRPKRRDRHDLIHPKPCLIRISITWLIGLSSVASFIQSFLFWWYNE